MVGPSPALPVIEGVTVKRDGLLSPTSRKAPFVMKLSPIHPGEVLRDDFLAPNSVSANGLAMHIRVRASRIGEIINA